MSEPRPTNPRILLVTGMSGAGKSSALDALEDMGWDVVDNLPVDLLGNLIEGGDECRIAPIAVAMDVRSRGFDPATLPAYFRSLEGVESEILFLDCNDAALVRRFDSTRRRHPLAQDRPVEDGIHRERRYISPLKTGADQVIDTSDLKPLELRAQLAARFDSGAAQPVLTVTSFGFSRGIARSADLVLDVRFLPNPYWVEELRDLSGTDAPVRDYLASDPAWDDLIERTVSLLKDWIPRYWAAGKNYVTVAFGCTGGRHRSVAAAIETANRLRDGGFEPNVRHRDLDLTTRDAIERIHKRP